MDFFTSLARNIFFTGKGGVGKTTLACATAIRLADQGWRVLLVCTDPASNLQDVLETEVTSTPGPVPGCKTLSAVNINPEESARAYREKIVGPYRGKLPPAAITSMEEQLSGACTMEIAAFDEFAKLVGSPRATADKDFVVFDTAPTGHTLRLLQLPSAWDGFIETNTTGTSCLGPLSGLTEQQGVYKTTIQILTNGEQTTVILVSRPEKTSLAEADRTRSELTELGIANIRLLVNGVFTSPADDPIAMSWAEQSRRYVQVMPPALAALARTEIPLLPFSPLGLDKLRTVFDAHTKKGAAALKVPPESRKKTIPPPLSALYESLLDQQRGVIMTMGKGGVGKTRIATEIALTLCNGGKKVHLATTDPADHLDRALIGQNPNLTISNIDPAKETRAYSEKVMREVGAGLDDQGKKLLAEDLRSPCTEEIAVFQAFARLVDQGADGFVVLDTAPTGHTLLLLDATLAYHREISRSSQKIPEAVNRLLPRLRDGNFTQIFIVTLPEATPVHEADALQSDLRRAGIYPKAWIINQTIASLEVTDPFLLARQEEEYHFIEEAVLRSGGKIFLSPWQPE